MLLHGNIGQGAALRIGDIELFLILVVFVRKIVLDRIVHHDLALIVLADVEMVVHTNEINLLEAHVGRKLCRRIHAGAGIVDPLRDVVREAKLLRILRLLRHDVEICRAVDGNIVPPFQLNRNELRLCFQAAYRVRAARQHLLVLGDVIGRPPRCLLEDVVDAVEGKGDLAGLVQPGQILRAKAWAVADEEAATARIAVLVSRQALSVFCFAEVRLLVGD